MRRLGQRVTARSGAMWVLGVALLAAGVLRAAEPQRRLELFGFERPCGQINLGGEFPGAVGTFQVLGGAAHDAASGGRLSFDLTRGAYVAWVCDPPVPLVEGARELTVWVRADAPGRLVHCKTRDVTGQEHIRYAPPLTGTDWQQLTFDLTRHAGHWSGANDGVIHWPITTLQIGVEAQGTAKTGDLDLDTLAVTTTAGPAAQPGMVIRLDAGRFGNLFYAGEPVEFAVLLTRLEARPAARLVGTYSAYDWQDREVARGEIEPVAMAEAGEQRARVRVAVPGYGAFRLALALRDPQVADETATAGAWFGVLPGPNPPPCGWVGSGLHGGHGWARGDLRFLDLLSAAGIGVVREEFGWSGIEKVKGEYAVSPRVEQFVDALRDRGIRLNLLLTYGNALYENPLDPGAYARWAAWMATHFAGRVSDFEIWNEPANFLFGKQYGGERFGDAPWIGKFVDLSLQAGAAIRAVRPEATVVLCAEDVWPTLKQMLEEGIGPAGHVVSVHPYCHGQPRPEREWFLQDGGRELRAVSRAHGGPARVVITEAGWTTYEGEMEYLKVAGGYPRSSYVHQAQYLVRMFLTARASGADYAIQYDFMNDGSRRNYTEHNFGLVHEDASPKPALLAVAALTRLLGQGRLVGDASPDPERLRVYVFDVAGRPVLAAYAIEGTAELGLPVGVARVEVADLMGNRQARECPGDVLRLGLTETPIYVLGGAPGVAGSFCQMVVGSSAVTALAGDTVRVPLQFTNQTAAKARAKVHVEAPEGVETALEWGTHWRTPAIPAGGQRTVDLVVRVPAAATAVFDVTLRARLAGRRLERTVSIRPQAPIAVRFGPVQLADGGGAGTLRLTNLSAERQSVTAAIALAGGTPVTPPETACVLAAGEVRSLAFRYPARAEPTLVTAVVRTTAGWRLSLTDALLPGAVARLARAPSLDGTLAEWAGATRWVLSDRCQSAVADGQAPWRGPTDLAATVHLGWCDEGLCVGVEVTDDIFSQPFSGEPIWQGDSVQLAVAPGIAGTARLEIGLARTPQGDRCHVYSSLVGASTRALPPVACVTRRSEQGGGVIYEALIPWAHLPGIAPAAGTCFRFSLLVNENDGSGRRGWLHAFDGIGWSKDPAQYGEMALLP